MAKLSQVRSGPYGPYGSFLKPHLYALAYLNYSSLNVIYPNNTDFILILSVLFLSVYIIGFKEETRNTIVSVHGCKNMYGFGHLASMISFSSCGKSDSKRTKLITAMSRATFFSLLKTTDKCDGTVAPAVKVL